MYFGSLPEEFLLVILNPKTGEFELRNDLFIEIALSGAALLELVLQGRIAFEGHTIIIVDETKLDDEILQNIFSFMLGEEKDLTAMQWIRTILNRSYGLLNRYVNRLKNKNLITRVSEKRFLVFKVIKYYHQDTKYGKIIGQQINDIVKLNQEIDPRTIAFLSLLYATNATNTIFSTEDLEDYMNYIRGMVSNEEIGKSIAETINNIIDALMRNFIVSAPYPY